MLSGANLFIPLEMRLMISRTWRRCIQFIWTMPIISELTLTLSVRFIAPMFKSGTLSVEQKTFRLQEMPSRLSSNMFSFIFMSSCFLSSEMEDAKTCIDVIMQCTLVFWNTLLAANLERSRDLVTLDEEIFQKVLEVKCVLEVHLQEMYSFYRRPDPQYSVILSDLWMCLNYNGCLEPFQK